MNAPGENLRIDGARLWDSIMEMAKIGPGVAGGNNRQTLTDADAEGRRLFRGWCEAAGLATLDTYREEGLFERAAALAPVWAEALHGLRDCPHVIDIRNEGLIGAVELEPIAGQPTKRAFQAFLDAYDAGILIRTTGDIIALSPPLIISEAQIDELVGKLRGVLERLS